MIRTKIVATLGPACGDVEALFSLFQAGVDVCRLNFSHGDLDKHLLMLRNIREAAARWSQPIAIIGDLCGPKIRLGKIAKQDGFDGMPIGVGDELIIQRTPCSGKNGRVSSIYANLVDDVQVGHRAADRRRPASLHLHRKKLQRASLQLHDRRHAQKLQRDQSPRYQRQCPLHHRPRLGMRRLGHRK